VKNRIVTITIVAAVIALTFLFWPWEEPSTAGSASQPDQPFSRSAPQSTAAAQVVEPSIFNPPAATIAPPTEAEDAYLGETFNVNAAGVLIVDRRAQVTLEQLYALYTPEQQAQRLRELEQTLPRAAHSRVSELLEQYKQYSVAAKQNFPPGAAPANEDDALVQLEGLSALRVAHFGQDAAQGLFGEDEKINRQLLTLMRLEKDESLTVEERAEQAQVLLSTMPDIAAIEKRNRESSVAAASN